MTHRRSKAVLLCAVCLLGSAAGLQAQQDQTVSITGAANVTSRNGSATATVGRPPTRPPSTPQERDARNRAAQARNARLLHSRVPALRKLHALREWQTATARDSEQRRSQRRRSR